jgi:hypothetical protein
MKVRLHSQTHEWRERDADGVLHIYRAEWDSRDWTFFSTTKSDPEWYPVPHPQISHYEGLRDVLWRKYQRRRLPWKFVEDLDALLEIRRKQLE